MRAVILAAGYGTRLERDLKNDRSRSYSHLIGIPKPLLPIGKKPLISHWIDIFDGVPEITRVVVVVNDLHKELYLEWSKRVKRDIQIISEGSVCNDQRKGAVACMQIGVQEGLEDTIFIAGDTLLKGDFHLQSMIQKFQTLLKQFSNACMIVSAPVSEEDVSKHGIIEVDKDGLVTEFLEKPLPTETSSRLQSPCVYIISSSSLSSLQKFMKLKESQPLQSRDATGMFVAELIHWVPVFSYHVEGRHDVGGLQSYIQCCDEFIL